MLQIVIMQPDNVYIECRCRPVNRASVQPVSEENARRYYVCARYFLNDASPFRSCFRIVSPEPFLSMCVNDVLMGDNGLEAQNDVCRTATAYVHECTSVADRRCMPLTQPLW